MLYICRYHSKHSITADIISTVQQLGAATGAAREGEGGLSSTLECRCHCFRLAVPDPDHQRHLAAAGGGQASPPEGEVVEADEGRGPVRGEYTAVHPLQSASVQLVS